MAAKYALTECPPEEVKKGALKKAPAEVAEIQKLVGAKPDGMFGEKTKQAVWEKYGDITNPEVFNALTEDEQQIFADFDEKVGGSKGYYATKPEECELSGFDGNGFTPPTGKEGQKYYNEKQAASAAEATETTGPRARPVELAAPDVEIRPKARPGTFGVTVDPNAGGQPVVTLQDMKLPKSAYGYGDKGFNAEDFTLPQAAAPVQPNGQVITPVEPAAPPVEAKSVTIQDIIKNKNGGLTISVENDPAKQAALNATIAEREAEIMAEADKRDGYGDAYYNDTKATNPMVYKVGEEGPIDRKTLVDKPADAAPVQRLNTVASTAVDMTQFSSVGGTEIKAEGGFLQKLTQAFERAFSNEGAPLDNQPAAAMDIAARAPAPVIAQRVMAFGD